jgi:hypothetical protein
VQAFQPCTFGAATDKGIFDLGTIQAGRRVSNPNQVPLISTNAEFDQFIEAGPHGLLARVDNDEPIV